MTLLLVTLLVQDDVASLVERLASDSVEVRTAAEAKLKELAPKNVARLRALHDSSPDADVKTRLLAVLRAEPAYADALAKELVSDKETMRSHAIDELAAMPAHAKRLLLPLVNSADCGAQARAALRRALGDTLVDGCLVEFEAEAPEVGLNEPVRVRAVVTNVGAGPVELRVPLLAQVAVTWPGGAYLWGDDSRGKKMSLAPGERRDETIALEPRPTPGHHVIEGWMSIVRGRKAPVIVKEAQAPDAVARKVDRCIQAFVAAATDLREKRVEGYASLLRPYEDIVEIGIKAFDALAPHYGHKDPFVRDRVLALAARLGGDQARPALEKGLDDPEAGVRQAAIHGLSTIRIAASRAKVLARFEDPVSTVRYAALEAMAADPAADVTDALLARLKDEAADVRVTAAERLADRGRDAGIAVLVADGVSSTSESYYLTAIAALEKLTGKSFGKVEMSGFLSDMNEILRISRENEAVRRKWLKWWDEEGSARYANRK